MCLSSTDLREQDGGGLYKIILSKGSQRTRSQTYSTDAAARAGDEDSLADDAGGVEDRHWATRWKERWAIKTREGWAVGERAPYLQWK